MLNHRRSDDYKNLVATDGSKTAQKADAYAVDLAKRLKAAVIDDYLKEAALEYVGAVKRLCDESRVAATISIRKGHPVSLIVKEAKRSKANLIVLGSQGGSALAAMVPGSVSYGVIHQVKSIPVLIVR